MRLIAAILLFASQAFGASYVVSTTNSAASDANPGTAMAPWKTISHATTNVAAGDTILIDSGTYYEHVNNTLSGTAGNPITYTGIRGPSGEWLTIIDPSTGFTNGWVAATEVASGVYKQINTPIVIRYLSINNSNVAFVWTNGDITSHITGVFTNSGLTTGTNMLTIPSAQTYMRDGVAVSFWDPIGALFCVGVNTNVCYLRLRDGSDPNGLNIRGCQNFDTLPLKTPEQNGDGVAIWYGKSNIVWQNVKVINAFTGFHIRDSYNITIRSNEVIGGYVGVYVNGLSSNNIVDANTKLGWFYGDPGGAWERNTNTVYENHEGAYVWGKYMMGQGDVFDSPILVYVSGNSNVISRNYISSGVGSDGITIWGDVTRPMYGTQVYGNYIEQQASVAVLLNQGHTYTQVYNNNISDCNIPFRENDYNTASETNRVEFVYRNTAWLPTGIGEHIFYFDNVSGGSYHPTSWVYHNSFSGGRYAVGVNSNVEGNGGLTNTFLINNIFSSPIGVSADAAFYTNQAYFGAYDYNVAVPAIGATAWFGAHNQTNNVIQWPNTKGMSFVLSIGSCAIDTAIDTTQPFVLKGVTYPALPQTGVIKSGPAWDIGAIEGFNTSLGTASSLRVQNLYTQ